MIAPMKSERSAVVATLEMGGISALILDDNQFDRLKIRRLFSTSGMPVYLNESDTLQSLSALLDKQEFDIILVDYDLSDSTGIEAVELVQSHPVNANAAMIMITGYDQSEVAVKALKMGCKDYLTKQQLSPERLRASVLSAIEPTECASQIDQTANAITLAHTLLAEYSNNLQPDIAQLLHDIHLLKAQIGIQTTDEIRTNISLFEQRCIRLWSALGKPTVSPFSRAWPSKIQ